MGPLTLTPIAFLEHLLKIISDENSFLERDLMKDIKQIERARENRSSDSTYQAVCNQRSEHANSTVSQQQQKLIATQIQVKRISL